MSGWAIVAACSATFTLYAILDDYIARRRAGRK